MQMWRSTSTMPSARLNEAPVGQTSTQGGSAQCWHITGSDSVRPVAFSFSSTLRIHCESSGPVPPERPFSLLQALTQASQPSAQRVVSTSMPQRTLDVTPFARAGSNRSRPGATAMPPSAAALPRKARRLFIPSPAWMRGTRSNRA